jgi:hypothetical protein
MGYFYEILGEKDISSSQALREAKLKLIKETSYKNPFYWGAFTIHGDFTNRPAIAQNSQKSNYLVIILIICVLSLGFTLVKNKTFFK